MYNILIIHGLTFSRVTPIMKKTEARCHGCAKGLIFFLDGKGQCSTLKKQTLYGALRWCLRLWPLAVSSLLLIPSLNPAAYLPQIKDWSYLHFLNNTMEVDKLFTKAYPGIREMFAANALLDFCGFATLICLLVAGLGSLMSFFKKAKAKKAGFLLSGLFGAAAGAMNLFLLLIISSANAQVSRLGYDALGMQYLYPLGATVLAALGALQLALYLAYRRLWMKKENLYIKMTRNERRENLKGFAFISPYLIGFGFFTAFPMLFSMFSSFTYYNITAVQKWYGLSNYLALFTQDDMFLKSFGNTLYYVVFSVPLVIVVAMILALLMNMRVKFMSLFRTVYYLPSVLSGVAVFLLWQWIFDPTSGLLNNALGLLGIKGAAWLYDAAWTKPALIIMRLWSTGGTMILLLAALQGVPVDLYEAGELDGAVGFAKFRHITLPMISPTLFFVMVTGISGAFQVYDSAYIMVENGGPGKSLMFYNLYLFLTAFKDQSMGKASSMAWILFAIIMVFTLIQMGASKKWVHYEGGTDK